MGPCAPCAWRDPNASAAEMVRDAILARTWAVPHPVHAVRSTAHVAALHRLPAGHPPPSQQRLPPCVPRPVRGAGGQSTAKAMFGKDELAAILKFGAEELFREDERAKVEKQHELLAEDLDAILARAEVPPCARPCAVIGTAPCRTGAPRPARHAMPRRPRCRPALPTRLQRRACGTGRCRAASATRCRPASAPLAASATLAARCPSHVLLPPSSPDVPMHSTDSVSAHHGRTVRGNGAMQHGGNLGGPTGLNFDPPNQFQVLAPSAQLRMERELAEGTKGHPLRSWPE